MDGDMKKKKPVVIPKVVMEHARAGRIQPQKKMTATQMRKETQKMWSATPTPNADTTVYVDPKTAKLWKEHMTAAQIHRMKDEQERVPVEAWIQVRRFIAEWRKIEDRGGSTRLRRSYLEGAWNEMLPGLEFPPDTVPLAIVRARLTYTAQYQGFELAGALDKLPQVVMTNYQALHKMDPARMTHTAAVLVGLDQKYGLTMPRQVVSVTGEVVKRQPGVGLIKKEKSGTRVEMEGQLRQIAAGEIDIVFEIGSSASTFTQGKKGYVKVVDKKGSAEEYDLKDAARFDILYWRLYRWYDKERKSGGTK